MKSHKLLFDMLQEGEIPLNLQSVVKDVLKETGDLTAKIRELSDSNKSLIMLLRVICRDTINGAFNVEKATKLLESNQMKEDEIQ